jgi:hypothetical protein
MAGNATAMGSGEGTDIPSAEELRQTVRDWDLGLREDEKEFEAAVVMLAALHAGSGNLARLSRCTGVPYHRVYGFASNLRRAGIWTPDGKTACAWDEPDGMGDVAFVLDVFVAIGEVGVVQRSEHSSDARELEEGAAQAGYGERDGNDE